MGTFHICYKSSLNRNKCDHKAASTRMHPAHVTMCTVLHCDRVIFIEQSLRNVAFILLLMFLFS